MMSYGSTGHVMPGLKLFYAGRFAVGVCGDCRLMPIIQRWFDEDCPPNDAAYLWAEKLWSDDFDALVMDEDGRLFTMLADKLQFLPHEFFSIGSGSLPAFGAMAMNASATDAILVSALYDHNTNDIIESISLDDLKAHIAETFE
jgi:hypothetical protein